VPPLSDHLVTRWRVTPESLAPIRYLLRRWLTDRGAGEQEAYDIIVAAQEACANAVEHAYGPTDAEFGLAADYDDGVVTITITDSGRWREPRGENRGRGLPIMEAFADSVDIRRRAEGTAVTLTRRLATPA
jgi:anti-sigma regulatory factor (Ser/Thr protein kinase)